MSKKTVLKTGLFAFLLVGIGAGASSSLFAEELQNFITLDWNQGTPVVDENGNEGREFTVPVNQDDQNTTVEITEE